MTDIACMLLYQEGFCTREWVGARVLYQQMWSERGHQKRGFRDRAKYRYYVQYVSEKADSTSVKIQQGFVVRHILEHWAHIIGMVGYILDT